MAAPWWRNGKWQRIDVGGGLQQIIVPVGTEVWCGHGENKEYRHATFMRNSQCHPSLWIEEVDRAIAEKRIEDAAERILQSILMDVLNTKKTNGEPQEEEAKKPMDILKGIIKLVEQSEKTKD